MPSLSRESAFCGIVKLMTKAPIRTISWIMATKNVPRILPHICFSGDTLVTIISMTRELFSAVISVAINCPVIMTAINSRIIIA